LENFINSQMDIGGSSKLFTWLLGSLKMSDPADQCAIEASVDK
jgi:hypothetical protein